MTSLINVGIGETGTACSPDILRTILGSCIGICLYDSLNKVGGLAHIILPEKGLEDMSDKKYADSAIPLLLDEVIKSGASPGLLTAKITGGANMFRFQMSGTIADIGDNNIRKTREVLGRSGIKIVSEDVGGYYGRTVDFFLDTGKVKIKSLSDNSSVII